MAPGELATHAHGRQPSYGEHALQLLLVTAVEVWLLHVYRAQKGLEVSHEQQGAMRVVASQQVWVMQGCKQVDLHARQPPSLACCHAHCGLQAHTASMPAPHSATGPTSTQHQPPPLNEDAPTAPTAAPGERGSTAPVVPHPGMSKASVAAWAGAAGFGVPVDVSTVMQNPVYTKEYMEGVKPVHIPPKEVLFGVWGFGHEALRAAAVGASVTSKSLTKGFNSTLLAAATCARAVSPQ